MKTIFIYTLLAVCLIACQDTPDNITGVSTVDSPSLYQSGSRLARFGDAQDIAVIFVDADQNMLSIHSLQADLQIENPACVSGLSSVSESGDVDQLHALLESQEHFIWVAEIDPAYEQEGGCKLGLCCEMLKRITVTFNGKGFIEYSAFPWIEEDDSKVIEPGDENDVTALPKQQSNEFLMRGFGKVRELTSGKYSDYESYCSMKLDVARNSEADIATIIKEPYKVLY